MKHIILRTLLALMVLFNNTPLYAGAFKISEQMPCHQKQMKSDCEHCQQNNCAEINCSFHASPLLFTNIPVLINHPIKNSFYNPLILTPPQKTFTDIERPPQFI